MALFEQQLEINVLMKDVEQGVYLKHLLSHLLTFIQDAIAKFSGAKHKELKVVATYHTKLIEKVESEK